MNAGALITASRHAKKQLRELEQMSDKTENELTQLIQKEARKTLIEFNESQSHYRIRCGEHGDFSMVFDTAAVLWPRENRIVACIQITLEKKGGRYRASTSEPLLFPDEADRRKIEKQLSRSLTKRLGLNGQRVTVRFWYDRGD